MEWAGGVNMLTCEEFLARLMSVPVVCTCMQAVVAAVCDGAEPSVPPAALEAAWKHDAAGDHALSRQRFQESLAFFAASCSSGDPTEALGTCLTDLLSRAQGKEDQWRRLMSSYETSAPGVGKGGSEMGGDDLDMLEMGADDEDEARPAAGEGGGMGPADGGSAPSKAPGHAAAPAAADDVGRAADDDAMSMGLGLSRATSHISISSGAAVPKAAKRDKDAGPRGQPSSKSLGGQLAAELSEASSGGDLPDDIDFDNPSAAPQHSHASPKAPAPSRQPLLKSLMASEEGKGHLADLPMDLRSWAKLKDQQQGTAMTSPARGPPMASPGRTQASFRQHAGGLVPLGQQHHNPGRSGSDASTAGGKAPGSGPGPAPPLLAARTSGLKGNPLHNSIINSSATRQSVERQAHERSVAANVSPARQRSIGTTLSRKPSVSEPGPLGPQAEWQLKHLPALGHASRLYPAELRQASHGHLPRPAGLGGAGAGSGARSALEDKLPALPALAGSRGPPKAMEMMLRKSSHGSRIAEHNADHRAAGPGEGRLPGLGAAGGRGQGLMQLPQRNSGLKLPSKRNLRGDLDF